MGRCASGSTPRPRLLADWGLTDDADGLRAFCHICVEAFAGAVAVVKPQVAFFERHGAAGLVELERLIAEAQSAGLVVIADAKRGDIDSTADAYAEAWLSESSPLAADAVTAHAYLGLAALAPLVRRAGETGRGVLVVARSSNPEGRSLQLATTAEGSAVEDMLLGEIAALNASEDVPTGAVGSGDRGHPEPFKLPIVPARRHNSGSRTGSPGGGTGRRGDPLRRLRSRHRPAQQLTGRVAGTVRTPRPCGARPSRWPANCPPPWPESRPVHMNTPGRGAMVSPCRNHPH